MSIRQLFVSAVIFLAASSVQAQKADGELDGEFGVDGRQLLAFDLGGEFQRSDLVTDLVKTADNGIFVVGSVQLPSGEYGIGLSRFMADGNPDPDFDRAVHLPAGLVAARGDRAAVQADGKLLIAGWGRIPENYQLRGLLCRFLPDGSFDDSFAASEAFSPGCRLVSPMGTGVLSNLLVHADGRIVVTGWSGSAGLVARFDRYGNVDMSFNGTGVFLLMSPDPAQTSLPGLAVYPDGDYIVAGHRDRNANFDWFAARVDGGTGQLDTGFGTDGLTVIAHDLVANGRDYVVSAHVQPDGTALVAGTAGQGEAFGLVHCPAIAHLTPAGQLGTQFDEGVFIDTFCHVGIQISDSERQSDGKIVLAGRFESNFMAMRILPDGTRDDGFSTDGVALITFDPLQNGPSWDGAQCITSQGGQLLLGGYSDAGDKNGYDFAVARVHNNLIFDSSFD